VQLIQPERAVHSAKLRLENGGDVFVDIVIVLME
jgi:hypothetical protein